MVPGNHDVDRAVINGNLQIQNVQHAIASTPRASREAVEKRYLASTATSPLRPGEGLKGGLVLTSLGAVLHLK